MTLKCTLEAHLLVYQGSFPGMGAAGENQEIFTENKELLQEGITFLS